jgi:hypothetical protein
VLGLKVQNLEKHKAQSTFKIQILEWTFDVYKEEHLGIKIKFQAMTGENFSIYDLGIVFLEP